MKSAIKFHSEPELRNPYMVAAWPGMGFVATGAVGYLREKLNAQEFAEIESSGFFPLVNAVFRDQVIEFPQLPGSRFYYWKGSRKDVILFFGDAQPVPQRAHEFAELVLDVVQRFQVSRIFTCAAMPVRISHAQKPKVRAVPNDAKLIDYLKEHNVELVNQGEIGGMNGSLLAVAKQKKIEGVCLLGEIPYYTIEMVNPKASQAVLEVLTRMIDVKIDMTEIELSAEYVDGELAKRLKEEAGKFLIYAKPEEQAASEEVGTEVSHSLREEVERLFEEARKDRSKAEELKAKLDRWDIFGEYEDRFLDLFRRGNQ